MLERVPRDEGSRDPAFAPRSETIRARMPANADDPSPMGSPPVRGQGAGDSGMTRISFPLAREKCGLDGRLLRSAKAKAGEGRVSKAAGGRVRSMYRARGVCDGPCANRARDEVVAKTTAADFFADVSPRSSLLYSPSWFFNS